MPQSQSQSGGVNTFGQPISQAGGSIVPTSVNTASPIPVNGLSQPQTTIAPPAQPTPNTGVAENASIPSPFPTTQDIVNKDTQSTATQSQQSALLGKVASLMQGKQSLATLQTNQEADAGVPGLTKQVNDLNTQLQGLNDQATTLQTAASPGGSIQNQEQEAATGRGITAGGLSPLNAADLRKNQIQQAAIASQALTLKSAVYAAQGNLTLAKAAADRAAQVQFDSVQQEIDYQNSLLAAIQPQLAKEDKAQAAQLQADLQDRQTQVNLQIDNYKTGQAAIADALKNNPGNEQAHAAATQAAQLDPKDPNYLTKVQQLVAPFASDVAVRALDIASKQSSIQLQQGQIAQLPLEAQLKKAQIASSYANVELAQQGKQNTLEQQYRQSLDKVVSARSGGLGLQDQKVDQATHLAALMNQFKDKNGNFNIPPAQYGELALGLANLIAPGGQAAVSTQQAITQKTAKGDIGGALTYILGTPVNGTTQNIAKLMASSIDRQAQVASDLRDGYMKFLSDSAPTGLDPSRKSQIDKAALNQYTPILGSTGRTGTLPDGTKVTQNPDGSITDSKGNKYDQNGNKLK